MWWKKKDENTVVVGERRGWTREVDGWFILCVGVVVEQQGERVRVREDNGAQYTVLVDDLSRR